MQPGCVQKQRLHQWVRNRSSTLLLLLIEVDAWKTTFPLPTGGASTDQGEYSILLRAFFLCFPGRLHPNPRGSIGPPFGTDPTAVDLV